MMTSKIEFHYFYIPGLTPCDDNLTSKLYVFPDNSVACFWLNSIAMNFTDNDLHCRAKNGFLAYIPDKGVFDAVQNLRSEYGIMLADYYLGYTESAGRLYRLSGDEVTFNNFYRTEPNSDLDTCITIYGNNGIYFDMSCSKEYYGVCSSLVNSGDDLDTTTEESTTFSTSATPDSQISSSHCLCSCPVTFELNPNVNLTAEEEAQILEIKQNLTVQKSTLSSSVRKRNCASDDRKSSQAIGALGACLLGIPFGLIILLDCSRIINLAK
ncbi:uncharacterized protein LOC130047352 [Ostrea edulis]|uniref:uncharacterized protein LOC130047352 n=1 Tax=Ostrea edulis TaxID=37623 RepID=UPI0024AF09C0|nr:uncharacterized protein LOC130047352 [Ostrea edulis]